MIYTSGADSALGSCKGTRAPLGSIYFNVFSFVMLFIAGGLPFLGILIMNLVIVCVIKPTKRKKKQRKHRGSQKKRRLAHTPEIIELKCLPKTYCSDGQPEISTITEPTASIGPVTSPVCNMDDVNISINEDRNKISKIQKQLTIMTVVMTAVCFFCITSYYSRAVMGVVRVENCIKDWIHLLGRLLLVFNSTINVFIYIMTGSKFRSDLITVLCMKCKAIVQQRKN